MCTFRDNTTWGSVCFVAALLRGRLGMRLFQLSSVTGQLVATELLESCCKAGSCNPFPFLQYDLYSVPQPCMHVLYIIVSFGYG